MKFILELKPIPNDDKAYKDKMMISLEVTGSQSHPYFEPLWIDSIDLFYQPGDNDIWTMLNEGKEVVVEAEIKEYGT